jgi:integrase
MASIYKRNGVYNVVVTYTDENGKRRQKWESFHSEAEARRRKTEIEYHQDLGKLVIPHCETLNELLDEYVNLYGKAKWSMAFYSTNTGLIEHYISPIIGELRLNEINTRVLEKFYQRLQQTPAAKRITDFKYSDNVRYVQKGTITKINKLLKSVFTQAMKWDLMEKNPATFAAVPKVESKKREIWDAATFIKANKLCLDPRLKLSMNLAFACSLRIGEVLGLTWDCVEISEESIENGLASVFINKELQRVPKAAFTALNKKDVISVFPESKLGNKTVLILKTPKTITSTRKVFLPKTVAEMLAKWKAEQDEYKRALGEEYQDYGLVIANSIGTPVEAPKIEKAFGNLIKKNDLPPVVFHSLRHSSITYKLKLSGGDIKSVQGDSGHAQAKMVTDQYSHVLDENRKVNAQLIEDAIYQKESAEIHLKAEAKTIESDDTLSDADAAEAMKKLANNPEMMKLLIKLSKSM